MQQNRREEMRQHLQGKCATMFSDRQCSKKLLLLLLLLQGFLSRQWRSFALFAPCLHQRSHSLHYREIFQNFSNPLHVGHAWLLLSSLLFLPVDGESAGNTIIAACRMMIFFSRDGGKEKRQNAGREKRQKNAGLEETPTDADSRRDNREMQRWART